MKGFISILLFFTGVAYPLFWLFGYQQYLVALPPIMGILWGLKGFYTQEGQRYFAWLIALFLLVISFTRTLEMMYAYPLVINGLLLAAFGTSLWQKQTLVERLARLQHPDLSQTGVIYTRKVTQIWCAFFILNIGITLLTILLKAFYFWALYNSVISYILMGTLMGGEWLIRQRVMKSQ